MAVINSIETIACTQLSAAMAPHVGTYGYGAGTSGTEAVPNGARVNRIKAVGAASGDAATIVINGGDAIPILEGKEETALPMGNLVGPINIVFTSTQSYLVEWVTG